VRRPFLLLCTALAACALLAPGAGAKAPKKPRHTRVGLQRVATFEHQVTGVSVSAQRRIFVNFPRWTEDVPVSVAEVGTGGKVTPYPDAEWNAWRNRKRFELSPQDHFVCVQSVVVDHHDNLWVVDAGAPAMDFIVPGAPKLVEISLATNTVTRVIPLDESVAPQGSYMNDIRFTPDDRYAFVTDSGQRGAIVVVDLLTGAARRTLDGHPSTQPEPSVTITVDGRPLERPDGRRLIGASDGITISPDGTTLSWQALTGVTLYSVPVAALESAALTPAEVAAQVAVVGRNGVADGLWSDERGIWVTSPENDAIKLRTGAQIGTVVKDRRLDWPDTFSQAPDGTIYVTASRIPDMQWFKPRNPPQLTTTLWALTGTAR
jgi:sugar lactone lactonase YvrE